MRNQVDPTRSFKAILDRASCDVAPSLVLLDLPLSFSRMATYKALAEILGSIGRPSIGILDLTGHPDLPAQTTINGNSQDWPDLAIGLPDALAPMDVIVLIGFERMLSRSPSRFAAFLQAHASERVLVAMAKHASDIGDLQLRRISVHIDRSLLEDRDPEKAGTLALERLASAAI